MLQDVLLDFELRVDGKEVSTTSLPTTVEDAVTHRVLHAFFIDVACKFDAYWKRYRVEESSLIIGIGPWHALGHKVECAKRFGARALEGTGRTFGDGIEHLWAVVRPHNPSLKYMAKGPMMDYIQHLLEYKGLHKALRLPTSQRTAFVKTVGRIKVLDGQRETILARTSTDDTPPTTHMEPSSTIVTSLAWEHHYQEALEEYYAVGALDEQRLREDGVPLDADGNVVKLSVSERKLQKSRWELLQKVREMERKHEINQRWATDAPQFQRAATERASFHIAQHQGWILNHLRSIGFLNARRQHRNVQHGMRTDFKKADRKKRESEKAVKASVQALKEWHLSPFAPPCTYEVTELDAERLLSKEMACPWVREGAALVREHLPSHVRASSGGGRFVEDDMLSLEDVDQQKARAMEELRFIRAEMHDMSMFYSFYLDSINKAMASLETSIQSCMEGQRACDTDNDGHGKAAITPHMEICKGKCAILKTVRSDFARLHDETASVQYAILSNRTLPVRPVPRPPIKPRPPFLLWEVVEMRTSIGILKTKAMLATPRMSATRRTIQTSNRRRCDHIEIV
uniref:Uncharacterized protein n=2 Tax=Pyramimonas obovata TaxID=1411642 RepID=A0A7S0RIL7_9CHLO|mmetsp:Transcript_34839/g.76151  ORF Transcript_34839/g.76151 Transcript_34839/m.76151 type:complete len:572 (+) Transcript_34839:165-1880(+)